MIKAQEHFYTDDPAVGPPDVRTALEDCSYFFLGNGLIQAAVQFAPAAEGTPLGLLIMDPDVLGKKRDALTMDPESGLSATAVEITVDGSRFRPVPAGLRVRWDECAGLPTVCAEWSGGGIGIQERFFCPDRERPELVRWIHLRNMGDRPISAVARTGIRAAVLEKGIVLDPSGEIRFGLRYILEAGSHHVRLEFGDSSAAAGSAKEYWNSLAAVSTGEALVDRFFQASKFQLPAAISRAGKLDGSVWQYNREWVRDQSVIVSALASLGDRGLARTMLERMLDKFVTSDGDTVDSSERRGSDEVELDQNGYLLLAAERYAAWTGDLALIRNFWPKIAALAEFPLQDVFRHGPSGLLMNRREYWERHRIHGIETGLELAHQIYVAAGLDAAAALARRIGESAPAARWAAESGRLRRALLEDRAFRMADNRGFLKRRAPDGRVQETIAALAEADLPDGVPLRSQPVHYLNPDASAALPIVLGLVAPDSPLAALTLSSLDALWNQAWTGGGYGRYHFTSEPDSAGPWPFASLFVARAGLECGRFDLLQRVLAWLDSVPGAAAGSWFEFYGRRMSPPFPQVGIIPWTWAEFVHLVIDNMLGVRPLENGLLIRPLPFPGESGPVRAELMVRGVRLQLEIERPLGRRSFMLETAAGVIERTERSVVIEYPRCDTRVRFL
jgi:hypothetical protein